MAKAGYEECTGCHVCVLPCPVWKATHDMSLTLAGRAKAMQAGASAADLLESLEACVLCGACEPVCPVEIDTIGMTLDLRRELAGKGESIFAGADGTDIAAAVEAGLPIAPDLLERFLAPLRGQSELVVAQGVLHRPLRQWLPGTRVIGFGESVLRKQALRETLGPGDMLVIETRGYHADFRRLAPFYDALRLERGCLMNLDMQRAAIPTGAMALQRKLGRESVSLKGQADWILEGRKISRVIVESPADKEAFAGMNVVTLGELAAGLK